MKTGSFTVSRKEDLRLNLKHGSPLQKWIVLCLITIALAVSASVEKAQAAPRLQDAGEKLVIVIDPGHGGNQLGTTENNHEEKGMTLVTARAMYEELSLYEGVEVYLTRTDDRELSLKKRAEFAASVEADFLFSIHYNASETHENYGSEVWVSLLEPYNAYGYQAGCEFLTNFRDMGLFVRGVKTRKGDKGDYYGIIRESVALGFPAVIVEHCHVDEARDEVFCADEEQLKAFGRADATAVARYFGLKSSVLNVDYSAWELAEAEADKFTAVTVYDVTEPDVCRIEFLSADYENGRLELSVSAADYDTALLSYSYSLDGGVTFGARQDWPQSDALTGSYPDTFTLNIPVPAGTIPRVVVRAYNMFDKYRESNLYTGAQAFRGKPSEDGETGGATASVPEPSIEPPSAAPALTGEPAAIPVNAAVIEKQEEVHLGSFLIFCLLLACLILILFIISQAVSRRRKRTRRAHSRKDEGDNISQPM